MRIAILVGLAALVASSAVADPAPHAPMSPKVAETPKQQEITVEDAKLIYDFGVAQGMAQAIVSAAQAKAKPALDKIQPPKS